MSRHPVPPSRILRLVIGFIVWSVAFIVLYATNAIGCAFGWDPFAQRATLIVLLAAHVGFLLWFASRNLALLRAADTEPAKMLAYAGMGLSVAALVSTLLVFAPGFFASLCI